MDDTINDQMPEDGEVVVIGSRKYKTIYVDKGHYCAGCIADTLSSMRLCGLLPDCSSIDKDCIFEELAE